MRRGGEETGGEGKGSGGERRARAGWKGEEKVRNGEVGHGKREGKVRKGSVVKASGAFLSITPLCPPSLQTHS